MNNPIAISKDVLDLVEVLRPALLRFSRALRREALRAGISALDAQILAVVKKNAGIGVSALAQREQMTPASMSGHVKRLEQAGWLDRSASEEEDRRRIGLALTPKGTKALEAIRRSRNDWLIERLVMLSDEERMLLVAAAGPLTRLTEDR